MNLFQPSTTSLSACFLRKLKHKQSTYTSLAMHFISFTFSSLLPFHFCIHLMIKSVDLLMRSKQNSRHGGSKQANNSKFSDPLMGGTFSLGCHRPIRPNPAQSKSTSSCPQMCNVATSLQLGYIPLNTLRWLSLVVESEGRATTLREPLHFRGKSRRGNFFARKCVLFLEEIYPFLE